MENRREPIFELRPPDFLDNVGRAYFRAFLLSVQGTPDGIYGMTLLAYLCQRIVRGGKVDDESFRNLADEYFPIRRVKKNGR